MPCRSSGRRGPQDRRKHGAIHASSPDSPGSDILGEALCSTGQIGERLGRVRLGLLTLERMLSVWSVWTAEREHGNGLRAPVKSLLRDIQAREVHADFLAGRIVSVVAVLFLPPTLIGTIHEMNFDVMPELGWRFSDPLLLGLMVLSAAASWAWFRWRGRL
ncbi:Mg2+ and Co2+ transporter [Rubellimicrobium thermophilum DSM 16684]|uniref:Mg2+ and Co2+ transporter n=1 Tax=Rubellimicrobium thermophilum DSM 16684 TaxID=1123069 RepID=S9SIT1_9RHOB|nr:CorA family divalent cation transporter [Rubellimicrobium thermophilum]EPX86269.1 Mg2+ and Co2+ transporter [Rubellimicrobium thermophilum DSM 16684]